ncbi:hypothetical protein [Polaribacter marinivivus]|uniref:Uncharacterized protein n=1 Tax=Polaribacter marinivivus TaxID=1524260 RepID=A0ABV8RCG1_9FLAO
MATLEKEVSVKNQLRIRLNQKWSNVDFINLLTAVQNIYELYIINEEINSMKSSESFFNSNLNKSSLIITYLEQNFMNSESTMIIRDMNDTKVFTDNDFFRLKFFLKKELQIIKIKYASPGFADFGGFGAAIGHLKDLLLKLIEVFENRKSNKINNERKEIENDILRIERSKKFIELLKDINYPESKIQKILETEDKSIMVLKNFVENRQIENAE